MGKPDNHLIEICTCACSHPDHVITFNCDEDNVYAIIHLNKLPFLKRIKLAIKYIFGYRSVYGDFTEFIFDIRDIYKLEKITNYLKSYVSNNKYEGEKQS